MSFVESLSIRYHRGQLFIIDQTQLPHSEEWIEIKNYKDMIRAIVSLKVRGAPLIGVAAALSLAQTMESSCTPTKFIRVASELKNSRPTAVNLKVAMDRMLRVAEKNFTRESVEKAAIDFFNEDVELCRQIAQNGVDLIPHHASILTHCNTGSLATAGEGTALGVICEAHRQGKKVHVYVDETRPLLQGGRLTAWELEKKSIPYTLICDSAAASLMACGEISLAIVGADRIARNGDFANKVGTYPIAVLCHHHRIPFYTAAPHTTLDMACATGKDIPIEQRSATEVRGVCQGSLLLAPKKAKVYNPAFDVTPCELVQRWIFDTKVVSQQDWDKELTHISRKS